MRFEKNFSRRSVEELSEFFQIPLPQEQLNSLIETTELDDLSIILTTHDLYCHIKKFYLTQKKYRSKQKMGYRLLGDCSYPIDTNAEYYIKCFAPACDNRPVIARCDNQVFEGNTSWIVDLHNLVEIV